MSSVSMKPEVFNEMIEKLYPQKYTILGKYTKSSERIKVKYNDCGHIAEPKAAYLRQGAGCPICNRGTVMTHEEFFNIFSGFTNDKFELLSFYKNRKTNLKIKHRICGTIFSRNASVLLSKKVCHCPKCYSASAVTLVKGVNDIFTVNPELAKLLANPEDAYNFTSNSKHKALFRCPYCGKEELKNILSVNTYGLCCSNCNSNYSYGERFVSNMLYSLNIPFEHEYSPEWAKPYRYDFKFEYNSKKYIIEVDGAFHFSDNTRAGISKEQALDIDRIKEQLAVEHGFEIVRLNYNYSYSIPKFETIKNSITTSQLYQILPLHNINFEKIDEIADKSVMEVIVNKWNDMKEKSLQELCKDMHISDTQLRQYLYKAADQHRINESVAEIKELNRKSGLNMYGPKHKIMIQCNETGEVFNTINEANKKYHCNIYNYFRDENRKHAGVTPDGVKLTWTKLNIVYVPQPVN